MLQLETGTYSGQQNKRTFRAGVVVVSETEYIAKVLEGWYAPETRPITFMLPGSNRRGSANFLNFRAIVIYFRITSGTFPLSQIRT